MIKVESVTPAANVKLNDPEFANGRAELLNGSAIVGKGVYHVDSVAAGTMVAANVCGKPTADADVAVNDIKLVLHKEVIREYEIAEDQEDLDLGNVLHAAATAANVVVTGKPGAATVTALSCDASDSAATLTGATAGTLTLKLDVNVAEGTASSDLLMHNLALANEEVHVDMLCKAQVTPDMKPDRTSFTVVPASALTIKLA